MYASLVILFVWGVVFQRANTSELRRGLFFASAQLEKFPVKGVGKHGEVPDTAALKPQFSLGLAHTDGQVAIDRGILFLLSA